MGRIITAEEIVLKHIPSQDSFVAARKKTMEECGRLVKEGKIVGAKIYGSVAGLGLENDSRKPSVRSDLDILLVYRDVDALEQLHDLFTSIAKETYVYAEVAITDEYGAINGEHLLTPFLLRCIRRSPTEGNVVGDDPSWIIQPQSQQPQDVYKEYLKEKLESLRRNCVSSIELTRLKALQRSLEVPVNVGRITLDAYEEIFAISRDTDDGKLATIRDFRNYFHDQPFMMEFGNLTSAENEYNVVLGKTIKGQVSLADYNNYLAYLGKRCIPDAISFTKQLKNHFESCLEGNYRCVERSTKFTGKEK